ncbi:MAG TPA: class I SAM-dependent methyltransferase, partial [Gemmatimonadaceae bacterium]|nr:class I SAM-dependent methyltransferase [Gemmatimonadaceae bacterium]
PRDAQVLDVGSGDGLLAKRVMELRPDVRIRGVDVLARPTSHIPVEMFDGVTLPFGDYTFDAVMMVDVLHHAIEQDALLREMSRVTRGVVVIKDHLVQGVLAHPTLRFMDWVGNVRHGVALPYAYWTRARWQQAFDGARLRVTQWRDALGLYPFPANLLFERKLHFVSVLAPRAT